MTKQTPISSFTNHRSLIFRFVEREIFARYRGSMLGILWSLITPLIMLAIYSFIFTIVFKARFGTDIGRDNFAIILFSGLILHSFFTECLIRTTTIILENANFVKKVVFPLEILSITTVFSVFFQFCISFLVLIVGLLVIFHEIPLTALLVPIVIFPLILLTLGLSWFLASLGVYIRDIAHIMGIFSTILLFMSTIFYPATSLPDAMQIAIYANPLSFIVDQFREVLIYGHTPDWLGLGIYTVISLIIFSLGFTWFQKTRRGFADVL